MRTVVFLDLDGTLWEQGEVPETALAAIRAAQERGHKFLCNTGRTRSEVRDLGFIGLDGYCFAAGAEVILDGQTVVDERFDLDTTRKVMQVFDSLGFNYNIEGGSGSWVVVNDQKTYDAMCAAASGKPDPIMFVPRASHMTAVDFDCVQKLFYHGARPEDYARVAPLMPKGVHLTDLGHGFAEVTRTDVSKATAMEAVRAYLGGNWRTMAVGDSDNDLPMLRAADVSVCMGNGNDAAKQAATWVTSSLHEDGLARAFEHFGLTS